MEALGGLAVAARDIRAFSTARADRARAGDSPTARARLALPVRQEDLCGVGHRTNHVETACTTDFSLVD